MIGELPTAGGFSMFDTGYNNLTTGSGWSGMSGASASTAGATATSADDSSAAGTWDSVSGAVSGGLRGCTLCQNPMFLQGAFFVGAFLLVIAWHTHLKSVLE